MVDTTSYRNILNTVCSRKRWAFTKADCSSSGLPQSLTWTCQVYVKGIPYEGSGPSKDKAYEQAAKNALDALKEEFPDDVPDEVYVA